MAREIERRFLVRDTGFLAGRVGEAIVQGYVAKESGAMSTRVRVRGDKAFLTLKGARSGIARDEFEYPIPIADALHILANHCGNRLIQKTRFLVPYHGQTFEVDVFEGKHAGLVIAEIELAHERQPILLPPWVGAEVSLDPRYGNFSLAQFEGPVRPFDGGQHAAALATMTPEAHLFAAH